MTVRAAVGRLWRRWQRVTVTTGEDPSVHLLHGIKLFREVHLGGKVFRGSADTPGRTIGYVFDCIPASAVPGTLTFHGARDCAVTDCTIEQVGLYGLEFGPGCRECSAVGNEFRDIGAGGIRAGGADLDGFTLPIQFVPFELAKGNKGMTEFLAAMKKRKLNPTENLVVGWVSAGLLALGVALASTEAGQTLIGLVGARIDDLTSWVRGLFDGA